MIDVSVINGNLAGAGTRYRAYGQTLEWCVGRLSRIPRFLLPPPQGEEGEAALQRLAGRAISTGPRCFQHIRDGVLGGVNWGGDNPTLDRGLERIDLDALAERLFERGAVSGIMVGIVAEPEGRDPTIRRLGGYVEPINDPYDYDHTLGIAQITRVSDNRYRVRVYETEENLVREWPSVQDLGSLVAVEPVEVPYPPRYRILQVGHDGLPSGDLYRVLPLIQSEWASQVRGDRTEEATGFPQAVISGEVLSGVEKRGPTNIIEMSADGQFKFVTPGDLAPMHAHHQMKLERLREELRLPGGSLGTQTPSGEALREAATKFVQMITRYARALQGLVDDLVEDYADAVGARPVPITIDINREYEKVAKIESIIKLWDAGLIPHAAAVREIHPFVGSMTSEEVEEFIASQRNPLVAAPFLPSFSLPADEGGE